MATAVAFTVVHKPTSVRYIGEIKKSWNKLYYSFDRETWHTSKVDAFKAAEASGKLLEAK